MTTTNFAYPTQTYKILLMDSFSMDKPEFIMATTGTIEEVKQRLEELQKNYLVKNEIATYVRTKSGKLVVYSSADYFYVAVPVCQDANKAVQRSLDLYQELNYAEALTLNAVACAVIADTGSEFAYGFDSVEKQIKGHYTTRQVQGLMGSLTKKGFITTWQEDYTIRLTAKGAQVFPQFNFEA